MKHQDLVNFYYAVTDALEQSNATESSKDESDEPRDNNEWLI